MQQVMHMNIKEGSPQTNISGELPSLWGTPPPEDKTQTESHGHERAEPHYARERRPRSKLGADRLTGASAATSRSDIG